MSKDTRVYFEDILESVSQIEKYTNKITCEEFLKNTLIQDAVTRRLEISDMPNLKKCVIEIIGKMDEQQNPKGN